jgi:uncharacterized protein
MGNRIVIGGAGGLQSDEILNAVDHRPWPLPAGPWIMFQRWEYLLFAHWPLAEAVLRPLVPEQLPLDMFEGKCYVAVTPFYLSGLRARGFPRIPGFSNFPELNVRTYVSLNGKPGVFFFSLDAHSLLAVWGANAFYRLPYRFSRMGVEEDGGWIRYHCDRRVAPPAEFRGSYRPVSEVQLRPKGTLANWLSERYCLYATSGKKVFRAEIHHVQWPLQDAEAQIEVNTMAAASRIALPDVQPLLHYSRNLDVLVWPLERVAC